ncbi:efflux RND transporter permease subunit [Alteromonas sp. KUL49]|uniref:efflux RND transporter permease subunit n=1 Tax=Alteromonas sp. KUL49 TaxID=2480798 RepID=UPI00102F05A8|nr:efflux RND transporter permease subunit [Alteromonas sp. KUL49]TAP40640.1 efflux RND transporter permease subunit [Alteromonas sp. KUL49]GEA10801.1 acriflavin resistance protein [Alteromonas sp. KUL49]
MRPIDTNSGVIAWFARNNVAANLLMWLLIVGGLFGAASVQKQVFPSFEINVINVRVPYLGAAPQEVEEGVILKVEEAIKDLQGIKQITSNAVEGMGTVSIQVEDNYNVQDLLDEVKVQVDAIPSFPADTEKPVVYRQKIQQDVLWISVYGDASERELKEFAKSLRDDIANLSGISSVQVVGARDYEISVELSEVDLQKYNLTFTDAVARLAQSSIDLPGGSIRTENGDILLRTKGQAYTGWDYAQIPLVINTDGTRVTLGDVAYINDGFVENNQYALFDGKPAVSVRVQAVGDQNALEISEQVNLYLDEVKPGFPANITADTWGDSSFYLADRLNMMIENMFFGALLVFIVLSLFMKIKLAFWVIVGLPVCFLGTLLVMPMDMIGLSINMLSLFAFILVLGIVVDDAIIMGESAYSEIDKHGHSADNVIRGVKKVAMPATFGVLTTIAAFSPMLMVSGPFGIIWKTIGLVVIVCLVFSLVESKLILPAHLVHMNMKPYDPEKANGFQRFRDIFSEGIKSFIENKYAPFLEKAIKNRYTTMSVFLAALILTIGLFGGGIVRFVFFPNIPSDFMFASVELEPGSSLSQRDAVLTELRQAMRRMDEQLFEETGERVVNHAIAYDNGDLGGEIFVELTKGENRTMTDFEIHQRWRDELPEIPGVKSLNIGSPGGPGGGSDLSFEFSSSDIASLREISSQLKDKLRTYNGVTDINDTFSGGSEEIQLALKPQADALGISLQQLGQQVRFGFYGAEVQRIQRDDEEIRVMVRYPKSERTSIEHLKNMRVRAPNGQEVPFDQVATFSLGQGFDSIIRVDGKRSVTITAKVDKALMDPQEITMDVIDNTMPDLLDRFPNVEFQLQGNSKEQADAMMGLLKGLLFALFAIYALLAIPLRSYSQPIIIMSVIPFGVVGAIIGHLVLGMAVSVLSICGIIALSGVVVNDSLIMVDFVNRARAEGHSLMRAAISAGTQRFRAIILTSLTTFMGLMPIVFEKSLQAQIVIPMAISLAFGILFATVITLLLVPSLYIILDDIKGVFRKKPVPTTTDSTVNDGA